MAVTSFAKADAIVLSGGAETAAVAVVEALLVAGLRPAVIAMDDDSLLRNVAGLSDFVAIRGSTRTEALVALQAALGVFAGGPMLPLLPTEDDGLWMLHMLHPELPASLRFSRARALSLGGLDKAELFAALASAGLVEVIAPTLELKVPADYREAQAVFGWDCIVKPAYKPWRASIGADGLKVVARRGVHEADEAVIDRLETLWALSPRWIAQPRLDSFEGVERSVAIVRGSGRFVGCEVRERLKHPKIGGTAVWVESCIATDLLGIAERIGEAIDLEGICELSFLRDQQGRPRLLELNTRPWLQVELVERSGFPIIAETVRALREEPLRTAFVDIKPHQWLQPERWLLCLMRGDWRAALRAGWAFLRIDSERRIWSIWSSTLPRIKRQWISRLIARVLARTRSLTR